MPLCLAHPPADMSDWNLGEHIGILPRKLDVASGPPLFEVSPTQETWGPRKRRVFSRLSLKVEGFSCTSKSHADQPPFPSATAGFLSLRPTACWAYKLAEAALAPGIGLRGRPFSSGCFLPFLLDVPAKSIFQSGLFAMCGVQIRLI